MTVDGLTLYKCPVCDTVIEVLDSRGEKALDEISPWGLELMCCGRAMERLSEQGPGHDSLDHRLVIQQTAGGVKVIVGVRPHPMNEAHHVEWIEVMSNGRCFRQFLAPGQRPEAFFNIPDRDVTARMYCNSHGLWSSVRKPAAEQAMAMA